jgi:hypothetical protein
VGAIITAQGIKASPVGGDAKGEIVLEVKLGHILALIGFALLIVSGGVRGRARRRRPPQAADLKWQRWLDLSAFGLILAGLLVMWAQK